MPDSRVGTVRIKPTCRTHHQRNLLRLAELIDLGRKVQSAQRHAEQEPQPGHDAVTVADAGRSLSETLDAMQGLLAGSRLSRLYCQQSGIPAGRADAFPVELVGSETPEPVAPGMVEPTVVLGVFSADDAPASVGFFSRMILRLISQHCLGVTPWSGFALTPVPCAFAKLVTAKRVAPQTEAKLIVLMVLSSSSLQSGKPRSFHGSRLIRPT